MKHERNFRLVAECSCCEGRGIVWEPRRGGNDPEGGETDCPECDGRGEIEIEPEEDFDDV